jgi:hypothetical protein
MSVAVEDRKLPRDAENVTKLTLVPTDKVISDTAAYCSNC